MVDIAHIHPMLVHFPLALLPVALLFQVVQVARGQALFDRGCIGSAAFWLLVLAAVGAVFAAMFGDMALDQAVASGVPMAKLEGHEELGQFSAGALSVLAVVEGWFYRQRSASLAISWLAVLAGVAVMAVVLTTAWFGGHLVYDLGVNVATAG